jgi:hypothetical protein
MEQQLDKVSRRPVKFQLRRVAMNVDGCIAGRSRTIKPTSHGFKG